MDEKWIQWVRRLQAIAQNGLLYNENEFDQARYRDIQQIAAEILTSDTNCRTQDVIDIFNREKGYATPKVAVRGGVFQDNKILLVREILDGRWSLPGGWADPNESPSHSIEREIWEESGFKTKCMKLAAVYDRSMHAHYPPFPYHVYKLFFVCDLTGGEAKLSNETDGVEFFPENELPELSTPRVTQEQILRLFEHYRHPELPTDFD